jgi:hypothetical protein
MALTTVNQIKSFLGQTSTVDDVQLEALRQAAEAEIAAYCNRSFETTNYVDFYSGNGTRFLALRNRPVTAVNFVWQDFNANFGANTPSFGTDTLLTYGSQWTLDWDQGATVSKSGVLIRVGTVWEEIGRVYFPGKLSADIGPAYGNIKVDYQAGFVTIPMDLQYCVAYLVKYMMRTLPYGASVDSEKIGQFTYSLGRPRKDLTPEIGSLRQMLGKYREVSF